MSEIPALRRLLWSFFLLMVIWVAIVALFGTVCLLYLFS